MKRALEIVKDKISYCCSKGLLMTDIDLDQLYAIKVILDKETPKKPYYEGDGYADGVMVYDVARCPNCDNVFEELRLIVK